MNNNKKFDILKFIELTSAKRKDVAAFLYIDISHLSRIISGQRQLTIPQILKLQQINEEVWSMCIEKEYADEIRETERNATKWKSFTGSCTNKIESKIQEDRYVNELKEKENKIETLRNQVAALQTELRICSEKIAFKDEMIERLMKIIEKQVVS